MGYLHIENLYRRPEFLIIFEEVYVTCKVHGTSGNISLSQKGLRIFPGGEKLENVKKIFNEDELLLKYKELTTNKVFVNEDSEIIIYGEIYGGKCQRMSHVYGKELSFIVFDIKQDNKWLDLPEAVILTNYFELEFVPYTKIKNTLENLNYYRDLPCEVSKRRGIEEDKPREGIVIKPITEQVDRFNHRWILKHKRAEFGETKTPREVDPNKQAEILKGQAVADEFVTLMRLQHILDKNPFNELKNIPEVIRLMTEDIARECEGEYISSKTVLKAIGGKTVSLYKKILQEKSLELMSKANS